MRYVGDLRHRRNRTIFWVRIPDSFFKICFLGFSSAFLHKFRQKVREENILQINPKLIPYICIVFILLSSCLEKPLHEEKPELEFINTYKYWKSPPVKPIEYDTLQYPVEAPPIVLYGSIRDVLYKDWILRITSDKVEARDRFTLDLDVYQTKKMSNLENKELSPLRTQVFCDTLFSKIEGALHYWNEATDKWQETKRAHEYLYVSQYLYSDSNYIFAYRDHGEWGQFLFIKNRKTDELRIFSVWRTIVQVYKMDGHYHFIQTIAPTHKWYATTRISKILNIEAIPLVHKFERRCGNQPYPPVHLDSLIRKNIVKVVEEKSRTYGVFDTGTRILKLQAKDDTLRKSHTHRQVFLFDESGKVVNYRNNQRPIWIYLLNDGYRQKQSSHYTMEILHHPYYHFLKINKTKD